MSPPASACSGNLVGLLLLQIHQMIQIHRSKMPTSAGDSIWLSVLLETRRPRLVGKVKSAQSVRSGDAFAISTILDLEHKAFADTTYRICVFLRPQPLSGLSFYDWQGN